MKAAANKPEKSILKKDSVVEENGSNDDDEWSGFSDQEVGVQTQEEQKPTPKPKADTHQKTSTDNVNKKKTKKGVSTDPKSAPVASLRRELQVFKRLASGNDRNREFLVDIDASVTSNTTISSWYVVTLRYIC